MRLIGSSPPNHRSPVIKLGICHQRKKERPRPDGPSTSGWTLNGRLRMKKSTLLVSDDVKSPGRRISQYRLHKWKQHTRSEWPGPGGASTLSGGGMTVTFLSICEHKETQYVVLHQTKFIRVKIIFFPWCFAILRVSCNILLLCPLPLPFHLDEISGKGWVFQSLFNRVFITKARCV